MSQADALPAKTDVLVLGAGMAGLCAAITAAEAGADVLLLEKGEQPGGSSSYAGGAFTFVGTDLQKAAGITGDSLEALRNDFLESGQHKNDPALVNVYVEDQLATYEFMRDHGVKFSLGDLGIRSFTRAHLTGTGRAVTAMFEAAIKTPKLRYAAKAAATRLHRNAAGRVNRVTVTHGGKSMDIEVSRGVILATGGFSRSRKLLQTYAPELADAVKHGGIANTGDGLVMATALGAGHADLGYVSGSYGGALRNYPEPAGDDEYPPLIFAFAAGAIMVNKNGERFVNEAQSYKVLSGIGMKQPDGLGFQIFDQKVMDGSGADTSVNNFKDALANGYIRTAGTIAELARSMNLDPAKVEASVAQYNKDARESGVDSQFGRKVNQNAKGELMTVDVAPYYIAATGNAITSTYGGVTVNPDMAVTDQFGDPIEGLYAVGETAGGFYGALYLSGSALSRAAITGRRAGQRAAASVARATSFASA